MSQEGLPSKLSRTNVLLLLLYAEDTTNRTNSPIRGRIRLQKLVFYTQEELRKLQAKGMYSFRPFRLGPYSTELYRDISWLTFEEVIREKTESLSDGTNYSSFALTSKGVAEVQKLLENPQWAAVYNIVANVKKRFANIPLESLLNQVHSDFPEYRQEYQS